MQVGVDQRADRGGAIREVDVCCFDPLAVEVLREARDLQRSPNLLYCLRQCKGVCSSPRATGNRGERRDKDLRIGSSRKSTTCALAPQHTELYQLHTCVDLPERSRPSRTMKAPLRAIFEVCSVRGCARTVQPRPFWRTANALANALDHPAPCPNIHLSSPSSLRSARRFSAVRPSIINKKNHVFEREAAQGSGSFPITKRDGGRWLVRSGCKPLAGRI